MAALSASPPALHTAGGQPLHSSRPLHADCPLEVHSSFQNKQAIKQHLLHTGASIHWYTSSTDMLSFMLLNGLTFRCGARSTQLLSATLDQVLHHHTVSVLAILYRCGHCCKLPWGLVMGKLPLMFLSSLVPYVYMVEVAKYIFYLLVHPFLSGT